MTDAEWLKAQGVSNADTLDALIERIAIKIANGIPVEDARTEALEGR